MPPSIFAQRGSLREARSIISWALRRGEGEQEDRFGVDASLYEVEGTVFDDTGFAASGARDDEDGPFRGGYCLELRGVELRLEILNEPVCRVHVSSGG